MLFISVCIAAPFELNNIKQCMTSCHLPPSLLSPVTSLPPLSCHLPPSPLLSTPSLPPLSCQLPPSLPPLSCHLPPSLPPLSCHLPPSLPSPVTSLPPSPLLSPPSLPPLSCHLSPSLPSPVTSLPPSPLLSPPSLPPLSCHLGFSGTSIPRHVHTILSGHTYLYTWDNPLGKKELRCKVMGPGGKEKRQFTIKPMVRAVFAVVCTVWCYTLVTV